MNANYQRITIIATAILLPIFLITLTFYVFSARSTNTSPQKASQSTPNASLEPNNPSFQPFQAPTNPPNQPQNQPGIQPKQAITAPPPTAPPPPQNPQQPTQNHQNTPDKLSRPHINQPPESQPNPSQHHNPEQTRQENPWMAQISPEQEARIDAVLDAAELRTQQAMTQNQDRRTAIETIDRITQPCFEELYTRAPDVTGHIILNLDIIANPDNRGTFDNVHIQTNYNLRDMTFENCIITTIQSATFQSQGTDRMSIEHGIQTSELPAN